MPAVPPVQAPEAPQKRRSVCGSTHCPEQLTCPDGHEVAQMPLTHAWPVAHAMPALPVPQSSRAPQNLRSLRGLTHSPPQLICPEGHDVVQIPFTQA